MLKLKIGKNFLITQTFSDRSCLKYYVSYMMGCFKGENKVAINGNIRLGTPDLDEINKIIQENNLSCVYLLRYASILEFKKSAPSYAKERIDDIKITLREIINAIKAKHPNIDIKVININAYMRSPEFKLASSLFDILINDKNSILSALSILDQYKYFSKRYASIPNEIKVIDNDLKKLSKTTAVCDRVVTTKTIEYLNLIEKATINPSGLEVIIKELPIYPSEKLGLVFSPQYFKDNKYLYKAAKLIYQGNHFGMVKTKIRIDNNFKLKFLSTIDNRFDNMFDCHNWSHVGYPHFGNGGFCAGEFNDVMAHAKEYGLDYYFIALKQYLTTANMRDTAGYKVWWYPIYNKNNELIYCAGLDLLLEEQIKHKDFSLYNKLQNMTWEDKASVLSKYRFDSYVIGYGSPSYSYHGPDGFLQVCREKEPEIYEEIMKGMSK